ncbi:hypothetical protein [Stappia sp. MMSF_3263]|uniref:hypothetical protein n=1 Tax=Stappia sp. MMSF_3263 TaxID=3046693 RepID=UPI00273D2427|nr:hypothetical protein [Stappia sp. MMSF_3263]
MNIKRVVILPTRSKAAFGHIEMPNGDDILVLNKSIHTNALKIADQKLKKTLTANKLRTNRGGAGKAA